MDPFSFRRSSNAVAAALTHSTLEGLAVRFWVEFGADWRCGVLLERLIDQRHRVLARCEALAREVALCNDGEEAWW